MAEPLPFRRVAMLERLESDEYDVVVVGGGITGVGVALDAAIRGLRTALVERDDFASGTSSKSSKLIHGGLRYLQQGEIRLVYQALRERQRLRRNAPHLVRLLPFLIPILTRDGLIPRKVARALGGAMWMYDLTGGYRIGKFHKRLNAGAALAHLPTMAPDRLAGGYLYWDATADDARLCLTVARTAAEHGATIVNRCRVERITKDGDGHVNGVAVSADDRTFEVRARVVVNAAGVWSDDVRSLDEASHPDSIRPSKGVHVTLPWEKLRNDIAIVIPVPGDKRSLFVVPWSPRPDGTFEHVYVGTTDTDYHGPIDSPTCTEEDVAYIVRALNAAVTTGITAADITATWAGLRPLVKSAPSGRTADLSRRHQVAVSHGGLITVTGGKLTTYREMAEDTVDVITKIIGRGGPCRTRKLGLVGAAGFQPSPRGTPEAHLGDRYGTMAADVSMLAADLDLGAPLVAGQPYLKAEAVYSARHEMAVTLTDILCRRTRAHLVDRHATRASARSVAELIAPELDWDAATIDREVADYEALCDAETDAQRARAAV